MRSRSSGFIAAMAVAVLALPAAAAAATTNPPAPRAHAQQGFAQLLSHTRQLPRRAVNRRNKAMLLRIARRARRISTRRPCKAARILRTYRSKLGKVRRRKIPGPTPTGSSLRGQLESDALAANVALMGLPRAARCGGARAAVTEATPTVVESDERHLRLRVSLPAPTFSSHQVRASEYQQMFMEGMGETGDEGKPGLPTLTSFLAVPTGADVSVAVNRTDGYDLEGVKLYPHQPEAVDQADPPGGAPPKSDFIDGPFVRSARAYRSNSPFPGRPAHAAVLGKMRELRLGGVDAVGGRYRARSRKLHVFTSIDVTVRFGGANQGTFANASRLLSPWEAYFERNYEGTVINWQTVKDKLDLDDLDPEFCGEDMLIVTSPALRPIADAFASARQAAGYFPRVVEVGSDPGQIGTTREQIQAYILGELNAACAVRPTYVVLFGDTSHVPTWLVPCADGGDVNECDIASDLPYSLNAPSDIFADVHLGRIPAHDIQAARAVVGKITNYENNMPAPEGDPFYDRATVTSYFQNRTICVLNQGQQGEPNCKAANGPVTGHLEIDFGNHKDARGYTRTAEKIRTTMATEYGHQVDRVYTALEESTPELYYNGDPIPDNLRRPAFAWNGTGTDLLNHYNDGRFLILHRDHGWHSGWSDPTLTSADVPSMTNGAKLPVVFGVNCSSAQFDIPGVPSFVEQQVMKPDGGAVAGFGDTRVSPTWANNNMAFGFFDAPFPEISPSFGSATPKKRLGDILQSGKYFMAAKNGVGFQSAAATYQEHYLYHLLGDPSGQMWSDDPLDIDVTKVNVELIPIPVPDPGGPNYRVRVNMGDQEGRNAVVTLYRRGAAIGRAVVNGEVEITPEVATPPEGLTVAFEQDGTLPDGKAVAGSR
jgi:hypothetical protein